MRSRREWTETFKESLGACPSSVSKLAHLGHCALRHRPAKLVDEPQFFGAGDEIVGANHATFGMLPADQRLHPHDASVLDVDLRLIMKQKLVIFDGAAQMIVRKQNPLLPLGGHRHFLGGVGVQSRFQFSQADGLLQVAYNGQAQALRQLFGGLQHVFAEAAHQHDAGLAFPLTQQAQHFNAVHARHDQVQQDQCRLRGAPIQKAGCVCGCNAIQAQCMCRGRDKFTYILLIVDDQDVATGFHRPSSSP